MPRDYRALRRVASASAGSISKRACQPGLRAKTVGGLVTSPCTTSALLPDEIITDECRGVWPGVAKSETPDPGHRARSRCETPRLCDHSVQTAFQIHSAALEIISPTSSSVAAHTRADEKLAS
jgi:hypothetical protein